MKNKIQNNVFILAIAVIILTILVGIMMHSVSDMQGNARVINYAGIVRGATQRLIKNELYGNNNDSDIERLDDILLGLQTGKGSQDLTVLNDDIYQKKLKKLVKEWSKLKVAIDDARNDDSCRRNLYLLSENYFIYADETVSAAEKYSDGIAKKLNLLEILIIFNIISIILILSIQIISEINANKQLSKIVYVDANTGLPNKRKCEEMLDENIILDSGNNVCCIMFDLNNLKNTNDSLGHETGDVLISGFANILRRNAPDDMFIGRFGGDEFIGIQKNANQATIEKFIENLIENTKISPIKEKESYINISFSCGYALSENYNGCTLRALMDIADKKMYINKSSIKSKSKK